MIAVLIIGVALFVVFELLFNKKLMSCIESGAALLISIILAIIGRCTVCIVFKIICLVIFALLLALAFFRKRGDDDNKEEEKEEQPVQPVEEEKPAENADVAQTNEESVEPEASEKDEGLSLKSSFAALAAAGGAKKFSKKFISEYLEKNYKDSTELNCRENATKPGKGQTVGLPLADTHYVKGKNSKKCFVYVYEKDAKDEEKKLINEFEPVWMKDPKDCTDDDYISFYHTNFEDINNPLFWIHLNMDYPVKLKGVLYFPKFTHDYELNEGKVKLYCNQVYVADNIKEVIPDFTCVSPDDLSKLDSIINGDIQYNVNYSFISSLFGVN